MKPTLPEHVKMYICTSCRHPYPDQPVTSCDCMPKQNDFREEIMLPAETVQRLIDEAYAAGLEDAEKTCDEQYYKHIGPAYGEVRYGIAACSASIRSLKPKGAA